MQFRALRMLLQRLLQQSERGMPIIGVFERFGPLMPFVRRHLSRSQPVMAVRPIGANGGT